MLRIHERLRPGLRPSRGSRPRASAGPAARTSEFSTKVGAWRGVGRSIAAAAALVFAGDAALARPLYRVEAVRAEANDYSVSYRMTGYIAARVQSALAFRAGGRIASRRVDIGDHVKADDVLAELDPKDLETAVANAEAAVNSALAQLREASATFNRARDLLASGFATRPAFDEAQARLLSIQASVRSAEADLGSAKERLSYAVLTPKHDGVIVGRSAEVGQVVSAGETVFTIAADGPRDAVFEVQESLLAHALERSARADVALLSTPSVKTTGFVREVSPAVDAASGTVRVKIGLDAPPPNMTLNASVVASGPAGTVKTVSLPESVLYEWDGKPAVWVVDPETRKVSVKTVEVEAYLTDTVVLSSGVAPGDLVVSAGLQSLRLGEEIELVSEAKP
ncbi:MAG: efflux RND transporter periplasmic adaptor subunit [Hyphomicrobiales bacterium]|nr:efflux RND transporter periplasmic adaptor subunit [Hyphomicrobiales bacterium]MBV8443403.1 efflux RND transporter periplasmic adaptor subunit [Hyphomicrobiales bacterium]